MRQLMVGGVVFALAAPAAAAADQLAEARRLYNAGQYEAAEREAREATLMDAQADAARVVLGRILTEKFRQTADPADLTAARESLRQVDSRPLGYHDRLELTIGQGEVLYFDNRFGAAAEVFETALESVGSARQRGARPCARLVGDRARSSRAVPIVRGPAADSTPASSSACAASWRSTPARRRPATGWPQRRVARAIPIVRGRRRSQAGCAPASRGTGAPPCGPTSIGS